MNSRAKYECRILAAILLCALSNLFPAKASGGTFALVQHVNNISCPSSSTTCTIPLNQSIAAGDLLIFESTVSGNSLITATDNGGTFVPCRSCVGFDQTNLFAETSGGWILSALPQSITDERADRTEPVARVAPSHRRASGLRRASRRYR